MSRMVIKFGGSNLKQRSDFARVLSNLSHYEHPVVVVSALFGVTDELERLLMGAEPAATAVERLRVLHGDVVDALVPLGGARGRGGRVLYAGRMQLRGIPHGRGAVRFHLVPRLHGPRCMQFRRCRHAAYGAGNADGELWLDIGGVVGSGVYALEREEGDPIWSEDWDAMLPGAYTFGMVDDEGCHSAQTHAVRIPFVRCD